MIFFQRSQQMQFHEKFWAMLNTPFKREKEVLSDLVFDFLMVLLETKTPVARSAEFLLELMNKTIEYEAEGGQTEKRSYDEIREAHGLWSMEKLVHEFRKLFVDKTNFMNIYSHPTDLTKPSPRESYYNFTHRPTINVYSAKLDVSSDFPLEFHGSFLIFSNNTKMKIT